jgi:hypothetical protein
VTRERELPRCLEESSDKLRHRMHVHFLAGMFANLTILKEKKNKRIGKENF